MVYKWYYDYCNNDENNHKSVWKNSIKFCFIPSDTETCIRVSFFTGHYRVCFLQYDPFTEQYKCPNSQNKANNKE